MRTAAQAQIRIGGDGGTGPHLPLVTLAITSPVDGAQITLNEPGQAITVQGTFECINGAHLTEVDVTFDGLTTTATVTPAAGSNGARGTFTAHVRGFHAGTQALEVGGPARVARILGHTVGIDGDTANLHVTLTHTTPTVSIAAPRPPTTIQLGESGADVQVSVTTADTSQYGGRQVTASVDGGQAVTLSPAPGSTTAFSGTVHFSATPLGSRALSVTCACTDVPSVTTTISEQLTGVDIAAPHVDPQGLVPPDGGNATVDPQAMTVHISGTASDQQSGMTGGHASVAAALSANGPKTVVTPRAPGDFSAWSVTLPVQSLGANTLYVWATDAAGNTMSSPQHSSFNAVSSYVPQTLDDRLSELEYLLALMAFANSQLSVGTTVGNVTSHLLTQTLLQPLDRIAVPLTAAAIAGERSVNELRVPIEVLRQHIAAHQVPTTAGQAGEATYLLTAYEALLTAAGTSYAELRLARGATDDVRTALASRLGIPLYGPTGPGSRPDQLDALTLEGSGLTEAALESLFGLPATRDATGALPDPLRLIPPAQLTAWRTAAQREQWAARDADPTGRGYAVIVDPDVITEADVLPTSPSGPAVLALLRQRRTDLQAFAARLAHTAAAAEPASTTFGQLLDQGLEVAAGQGVARLQEWQTADAHGHDIGPSLAAAGLDRVGYGYLAQLQRLAQTTTVTGTEWNDAVDTLVGSHRRRQYPAWTGQESTISLTPDTFAAAADGPSVASLRIDPAARAGWVDVLTTRTTQRAALLSAADEIVATAERLALPQLRDALLTDVTATVTGDPGDAMTAVYQVDMKVSGSLRTTRIAQATASLQALLMLVRSGDNATIPALRSWQLRTDTTPATFDADWRWLATFDGWRAATTTFLFPEAALDPELLVSGAGATATTPTPAFRALAGALTVSGDLESSVVDPAVAGYAAAASAVLANNGVSSTPLTYLSGRDRTHQSALASWSAALAGKDAALAREIFWAVPMFVAQRLHAAGQYQRALDWYWLVYPYNDSTASSIDAAVNHEAATAPTPPDLSFPPNWTKDLDPYRVVAGRPAPFLRATLLAVIGCLVDYADNEFTAETDESINNARNLYLTARQLTQHPRLQPVTPASPGEAALPIPQLTLLTGRVQTQLAKIRQGRNIAGLPRTQATAGSETVRQPTPYHFKTLLARAQQLTQQATQVEAEYLAALEKYDSKTLQLSDAEHALAAAAAQLNVHAAQVQEATDGVAAAQAQQAKATTMVSTYQAAIAQPSNKYEQALFDDYSRMRDAQNVIAGADAAIGIAQAAANASSLWGEITSFGGVGVATGVEIAGYAVKLGATMALDNAQKQAQANQLQASIEQRKREWQMQLAGAQQDVLIAGAQVQVATDHVALTVAEQQAAQLQHDQAGATLQLLRAQFTSADLYKWMSDTLGGVYRYFLQQATATARLAQAQLAFERAEPEKTFIRTDYWQTPGRLAASASVPDARGLTGAEQLAEDLSQLDEYAFSTDTRRLNITQTFSLAQLMPAEFLAFRATGQLAFDTPASWFDQDFPGHYQRLIRQVRLSIVGLVPPSRGVRATLSSNGISEVVTDVDGGMRTVLLRRDPTTVALTSPVQATGVFTLDPQPEMLYPFEGGGVATSWDLVLPRAANPFDFASISDVLLTVDYTALQSEAYRTQVVEQLNAQRARSADRALSLARDFPDQWYALLNPAAAPGTGGRSVTLTLRDVDFPLNVTGLAVAQLAVQLQTSASPAPPVTLTLAHAGASASATTDPRGIASTRTGAGWAQLTGVPPTGDWTLTFDAAAAALFDQGAVDDVVLVMSWTAQALPFPA